jgi:hypothetical protein
MIKSFDEFCSGQLSEGFFIQDNTILFEPGSKSIVNTSFGKTKRLIPYEMKLPFGKMYTVYKKAKDADKEQYNEVLSTIKGQNSNYSMDVESYDKFLTRTALYLSKIVTSENIDTIIVMETSSRLLADLMVKMNKYLPKYYEMQTYNKGIFKNPEISAIEISTQHELKPNTIKELERILTKANEKSYFSIKKVPAQFRDLIKNWLKINNKILSKIVDKRVMLIDDIVTTGSTVKEASVLIEEAGAKSLIGISIIKGDA